MQCTSSNRECDKKISIYQKNGTLPVRDDYPEYPSDSAAVTNIKIETYEKVFLATSKENPIKHLPQTANHKTTTLLTNTEVARPSTSGLLRATDDNLPSTPRHHNFSRGLTEPALIRENVNNLQAKCNGNLVVTNAGPSTSSSKKMPRVMNSGTI